MIAVLHFRPPDEASFVADVSVALTALAARPGFCRGTAARSIDDPSAWVVVTEWDSVGAYRRALGNHAVRLRATSLLAQALDQPSAFEQLVKIAADGTLTAAPSDHA